MVAYLRAVFGGLLDLQHIDDKAITATSLKKTSYKGSCRQAFAQL
jgi:hypothetical protein